MNLFWADLSHSQPPCRAVQRGVKRERGECASEQLKSRFMIHRPSIDKSSSQKFGEGSKSSWERDPCVVNNQRATISSHFVEHSIAANVFFLSSTYIPHVWSIFDWTNSRTTRICLDGRVFGMYVELKKKTLAALLCSKKWEEIVAPCLFTAQGSLF